VDLFVYGTLLFPEVLEALLHRVPAREPATAIGWRVAALPGRPYPGLVPRRGAAASGLVLSGLDRAEGRLLDAYEDSDYRLTEITLADGRRCPSYVWDRAALAHDWNRDGFAVDHLADYVAHCVRWRATADRVSPPSPDR
jgi:gamma-glutamylcyclotransferase (GGCT)/AIG2-like uncharacterized protein YtfP